MTARIIHQGDEKGKKKNQRNSGQKVMQKESVETTAIFTRADYGYIVTFPDVPGLTFHTINQTINPAILEEIEDAYDLASAKEAEARNDFLKWEDIRDNL